MNIWYNFSFFIVIFVLIEYSYIGLGLKGKSYITNI
jgi:hypothetical protein